MPTHVPPAIAGPFSAMARRLCPLALGALLIGLAAPESLAQDGRQTGARPDSLALSADSLQASLDREVAEQTAAAEADVVREAFDAVHNAWGVPETVKVHIMCDHVGDYFAYTGNNQLFIES